MKVALVDDWLTGMRGGERVSREVFCRIFPDAPIFTLFYHPGSVSPLIESHPIIPSRLQKFPLSKKRYRLLLPLYPSAIESFDLRDFDIVLSTSHAVAKGAVARKNSLSIGYRHTRSPYIWDQYNSYFNTPSSSVLLRSIMPFFRDYLRYWDIDTQSRVDYYIANSRFVAQRISRLYQRDCVVIPPPVDCSFDTPDHSNPGDFFLIVNALAPYKRVDLAIEAFNKNGLPLRIIGGVPKSSSLRKMAGSNITFLGCVSDEDVRENYRRCRALIFPGVEDFGLVPLEAQACGRPVIAFGHGGVETVIEGVSGHFFHQQTSEALDTAIQEFESLQFSPDLISRRCREFDILEIEKRLRDYLNEIFSLTPSQLVEKNQI